MMEVELKAPAPKGIERRLVAAGAKRLGSTAICDEYYDRPGEPLRRKRITLRIRTEGARMLLTHKTPAKARGVKAMDEIELSVTPAACVLLAGLGYGVTLTMRKKRTGYTLSGLNIFVDDVRGLGRWVEFEAFGEPRAARKRILAAAKRLGVAGASLTTKAYPSLYRERLKKGKR